MTPYQQVTKITDEGHRSLWLVRSNPATRPWITSSSSKGCGLGLFGSFGRAFFQKKPPTRGKVCDFPPRTTTASPPRNPTQEVNIDPGPQKKTHHDPRESTQLQFLLHSMVTIQKTNIGMEGTNLL